MKVSITFDIDDGASESRVYNEAENFVTGITDAPKNWTFCKIEVTNNKKFQI